MILSQRSASSPRQGNLFISIVIGYKNYYENIRNSQKMSTLEVLNPFVSSNKSNIDDYRTICSYGQDPDLKK